MKSLLLAKDHLDLNTCDNPLKYLIQHLSPILKPRHFLQFQYSTTSAATFQPIHFQRPQARYRERHHSTSSTGTFQPVDPNKPWNGRSTTIVNVDTHARHEWTDTEDNASVRVHPQPFFNNRSASNPNLNGTHQPFNYISFSQQLYGERPPTVASESNLSKSKRTISYV